MPINPRPSTDRRRHPYDDAGRIDFRWVRTVQRTRFFLSLVAVFGAGLAGAGYLCGVEKLYRLVPQGGATHPLTGLCALLLAASLLCYRPLSTANLLRRALAVIAVALAVADQVAQAAGVPGGLLGLAFPAGTMSGDIRMGRNTASTIILIGIAILLRRRRERLGFLVAAVGLFAPFVSGLGYLYRDQSLHGAMSPATAAIFLALTLSTLSTFAHRRSLRLFLRGDLTGRLARWQIVATVVYFITVGFALYGWRRLFGGGDLPLVIGATIWFVCGMIVLCAQVQDRADRARRAVERRMASESLTDPLTGLLNRRAAGAQGQQLLHLAQRQSGPLCVLLLDIDRFKAVNDTYGHAAGDSILRQVATVLEGRLRRSDIIARWGGEEFLAILPDASETEARKVAEVLRARIEEGVGAGDGIPVTVSIGIAARARDDAGIDRLIDRADAALYVAKRQGRNRVETCSGLVLRATGQQCADGCGRDGACETCPVRGPSAIAHAAYPGCLGTPAPAAALRLSGRLPPRSSGRSSGRPA